MKAWLSKVWEAIKKVGAWIRKLFEDANGVPSSKRVMSGVLFCVALVALFRGVELGQFIAVLSAALALQGVTAWQT